MPSPILSLPYLSFSGGNRELDHNQAIAVLEAIKVSFRDYAATPTDTYQDGKHYIVNGSPSGAFAGKANNLAITLNGGYYFIPPSSYLPDIRLINGDTYRCNGTTWNLVTFGGSGDLFSPSSTQILCNWETTIKEDISGNSFTNTGVTLSTSIFKFGTQSAFFNGSAYLQKPTASWAPQSYSLGDSFAIRFWYYPTASNGTFLDYRTSVADTNNFYLGLDSSYKLATYPYTGLNGASAVGFASKGAVIPNQWNLISVYILQNAQTPKYSDTYYFINGAFDSKHIGQPNFSGSNQNSSFVIGAQVNLSAKLSGYIDSFVLYAQVTKETIPTIPFT